MKVHEAMARAIAAENPGAAFTLMGNANMELLASLSEFGGPPQYKARIEGAAVTMAEGYARTTGQVGVASVTSGPGLANATNALCCASRNGVPLVVVTGHPGERSHQQYLHQEALANLVGAGFVDVTSANKALDAVKDAFYTARTESRPVILDVPRPISVAEYRWPFEYTPSFEDLVTPRRLPPDASAVAEALQLIASSERPVIVAGRGAYQSDARAAILALAEEIGALLATSLFVKNWFAEEPFDLGVSGLFHQRFAGELLAEADCVIGVGASLNHYTLEGGLLLPNARFIHIDTKPNLMMGNGRRADCYVQGDAKLTVEALLAGVRERGLGGERFRTAEVRQQIAEGKANPDPESFEVEPDRADARRLINALDEAFPADSTVVIANGHQWGITIPELKRFRYPQLYSTAFGSIGMAFPTALGAAVGTNGRPVLCVEGDGAFMMNVHTLDTLVQYNLPVFSVVMNDASFGAEEHQMRAHHFDPVLAFQNPVDFAAVAASLGCRSAVVRTESEMQAAVQEFLNEPGPFLVDAQISRKVVSVAFRRLHYGQDA